MSRDFTKPYTEQELEGVKSIFRGLPTFSDEGFFLASEVGLFFERIGIPRTPEQIAIYERYWRLRYGGFIPMRIMIEILRYWHDEAKLARNCAQVYDFDGDGYISMPEFEEYMAMYRIHNPNYRHISYAKFVEEADSNKDGKVSLDEFQEWIKKNSISA